MRRSTEQKKDRWETIARTHATAPEREASNTWGVERIALWAFNGFSHLWAPGRKPFNQPKQRLLIALLNMTLFVPQFVFTLAPVPEDAMQAAVDDVAGGVLVALQHAPAGALVPADHDYATHDRVQAAFEAMAPNTRRAQNLGTLGRGAAGLRPVPRARGPARYLLERASEGAGASSLTVSALRKLQALAEVAQTARDQLVADTLSGLARQAAALRRGLVDIALCWVISDAGLRRSEAAALVWDDVTRWDNGSGRLTVRRSKTDASPRTVYLTPVAMAHLDAIRLEDADGSDSVFGLSESSISRRVLAAARTAGLGGGYSGHSGRVGMARRMAQAGAPTHEIMAQGRWKSAGMVADYTRAENAERAAKWLG